RGTSGAVAQGANSDFGSALDPTVSEGGTGCAGASALVVLTLGAGAWACKSIPEGEAASGVVARAVQHAAARHSPSTTTTPASAGDGGGLKRRPGVPRGRFQPVGGRSGSVGGRTGARGTAGFIRDPGAPHGNGAMPGRGAAPRRPPPRHLLGPCAEAVSSPRTGRCGSR